MLTVFDNIVTDSELENIQQQFANLKSTISFDDIYYLTLTKEEIKDLYKLDSDSDSLLVQVERTNVSALPVGEFIRNIVNKILTEPLDKSIPIYFARSIYPAGIHVDFKKDRSFNGETIIIPLTFDERIKTLVWKETVDNGHSGVSDLLQRFRDNIRSFKKYSKLSTKLDLKNCWSGYPSVVDFLELDGMAEWKKGSLFKFRCNQLHASNNFKEHTTFKDYVLIHTDN